MSLTASYDPQNIFAQIIRGDAPCYKLYEDDEVLAFLDLFPQSFGHTLVIPKRSAACNILDVDSDALTAVMRVVQQLTRAIVAELQPDGGRSRSSTAPRRGRRCSTSTCTSSRATPARGSASTPQARPIRPSWRNCRCVCSGASPRWPESCGEGRGAGRPSQQATGTKVLFVPHGWLRNLRA